MLSKRFMTSFSMRFAVGLTILSLKASRCACLRRARPTGVQAYWGETSPFASHLLPFCQLTEINWSTMSVALATSLRKQQYVEWSVDVHLIMEDLSSWCIGRRGSNIWSQPCLQYRGDACLRYCTQLQRWCYLWIKFGTLAVPAISPFLPLTRACWMSFISGRLVLTSLRTYGLLLGTFKLSEFYARIDDWRAALDNVIIAAFQ